LPVAYWPSISAGQVKLRACRPADTLDYEGA